MMNYKLQLWSLLASFLYGIFFFITSKFNFEIINNKDKIFKFILNILYILNIVLLYIILMYKINKGIFHLDFLILVIIGYLFSYFLFWKFNFISLKRFFKVKKM